jgi:S-adenosylhomocysteine hydrolase
MAIRLQSSADAERFRRSAEAAKHVAAAKLPDAVATPTVAPVTSTGDRFSAEAVARLVPDAVNVVATSSAPASVAIAPVERSAQEVMKALVTAPGVDADVAQARSPLRTAMLNASPPQHASQLSVVEYARATGTTKATITTAMQQRFKQGMGNEPNWLLAAQLTRWMRNVDSPGLSLDDVARSFKAANPAAAKAAPWLNGAMVALLQKAYDFMPQWQVAPKRTAVDDDWTSLPTEADVWTQKLDAALQSISEVPLTLPLSNSVGTRLADSKPFKNHNVVMVQHMLGQAVPLCAELARAGMNMDNAEYVGVPYQKNPAVKLSLERGMGLKVTVPERGDIDGMWQHVCAAVDRAFERHQANGQPILVLDDGGYASKYIATKYKEHVHLFCVVEQTTRGLTEISQIDPKPTFAIANVAGSYGKRFESAQVGDAVVQCVRRVLDEVATTPTRKEVLVVGGGKVGLGVADSFKGDGARVTFFDPYVTPARKKELEGLGYTVLTDKGDALNKKFLVVGCSGHRSIDMKDFLAMSSPVFVASASSKRVEIDTLGLADLTRSDDGVMRRILAAKVNEQETWHYWTKDNRIVTAVADGLPANFQDVNSIAPELIDHTMALMLLGAEKAVRSRTKAAGLVELDAGQQFELQAQMEGLTQSRSSSSDIELRVGDLSFCGSKAAWLAIAKSPATPPAVTEALIDTFLEQEPMNPILLEALAQPKEISDAALDKVLDLGMLPHVARLMKNEDVRGDQEDRLVDWCTRAYTGINPWTINDEPPASIWGADKRPDGSWGFTTCVRQPTVDEAARGHKTMRTGTIYERDLLTRQLGEILFAHPRCPEGYKQYLLDSRTGSKLRFEQQANVHALHNPTWTTTQLHEILRRGASSLWSLGNEKPQRAAYAIDVFQAFIDHPSADEALIAEAQRGLDYVVAMQREHRQVEPLGKKAWVESPLGGYVPAYD